MCQENGTFALNAPPEKCVTPPQKMVPPYSLGTCPPKTPKPHRKIHCSFIEKKINFLKASFFDKLLEWPWSRQKLTYFKIGHKMSQEMSQAVLSPDLTKEVQWEVSQIADKRFPCATV